MNFYMVLFAVVICLTVGPVHRFATTRNLQAKVLQYASFMQNPQSRSVFYLFISTIEYSLGMDPTVWLRHWVLAFYFLGLCIGPLILKCYEKFTSRGDTESW